MVMILSTIIIFSSRVYAVTFNGVVSDEKETPIVDAIVSVWIGDDLITSGRTDQNGNFDIYLEANQTYQIFIFADNHSTPGVDYLPFHSAENPYKGGDLRFKLWPAGSLLIEGDIQIVESEELPLHVVYNVINASSHRVMMMGDFPLRYGSGGKTYSSYLGLEPSHIVVPAGVPFSVDANCSILIDKWLSSRSFEINRPGNFLLSRGEKITVDVREFTVSLDLELVEALHDKVELNMTEMEDLGFYIAAEKSKITAAAAELSEAQYLYQEGRYVESFDAGKRSYIALNQILNQLSYMYREAAFSVDIIIIILSLASTAIAFLLSKRLMTKLINCTMIYAFSLAILYLTYPGSVIVPLNLFTLLAIIAILSSITVVVILPKFLMGVAENGSIPLRGVIIPIFSIAKRNIERRRLRFGLTLASLTILVMSFVALTSFSQGYGLTFSPVPSVESPVRGIMLRASGYTEEKPVFLTPMDFKNGWLERQPETLIVSPKAVNLPRIHAITALNGAPIHGVIGLEPFQEALLIDLEATVTEGVLPTEDGVLISEKLRNGLGVEVGEYLALGESTVKLTGVFDDNAFRRLRELDGSTYIPRKLVNVAPEGEVPSLMISQCGTSEIVVTDIATALEISFVGLSRIDVTVEEGFDAHVFAERLALERGYMVLSFSLGVAQITQMGSYLEGKGLLLVIPYFIVILNVMVTMLNSIYERKGEIHILSSVGVNPTHISAIFFAEAFITGTIAGGVGYLAGLCLYKGMAFFKFGLEVHQKISALWCIASITIAMAAVMGGTFFSLKRSVVITPSSKRRWRFKGEKREFGEPWEITIPLKLPPNQIEAFFNFALEALKAKKRDPNKMTSSIHLSKEEGIVKGIDFTYRDAQPGGNFYTRNKLVINPSSDMEASVKLLVYSDETSAHITGSFVRMIAVRWSDMRGTSTKKLNL